MFSFDPHQLDAAYEELDARYAAGEGARGAGPIEAFRRFRRAVAARDWEALAAVMAPDCVWEDHCPVGVLTFASGEEYVASVRALVELAPDVVSRTHHILAVDARCFLGVLSTVPRWLPRDRHVNVSATWRRTLPMYGCLRPRPARHGARTVRRAVAACAAVGDRERGDAVARAEHARLAPA
jgi:hypothetical protein